MKTLFFLIAIPLVSCAPPYKRIVPDELKTLNDFSRAKNQLAENLLSDARDMDFYGVNYAEGYVIDAREIQKRLSVFDSNIVLHSVEESEMLTLALIAKESYDEFFYNKNFSDSITQLSCADSIVYPFLHLINHHKINLEGQKTKKILNENSKKTEWSLAEGIAPFFEDAMKLIELSSFSDEEKEIMLLYARILVVKYYDHSFRRSEIRGTKRLFVSRNDWLVFKKNEFLQNYPSTKYRPFLESIEPITAAD